MLDGNFDLLCGRRSPSRANKPDNLLTTTDAENKTTTYTYTPVGGSVTSVRDALGNTAAYQYDANGNVTRETDAEGTVTASTYDANNNRLTMTVSRTVNGQPEMSNSMRSWFLGTFGEAGKRNAGSRLFPSIEFTLCEFDQGELSDGNASAGCRERDH